MAVILICDTTNLNGTGTFVALKAKVIVLAVLIIWGKEPKVISSVGSPLDTGMLIMAVGTVSYRIANRRNG